MARTILLLILISATFISFTYEGDQARIDYIEKWKDEAIYQMYVHKIPASITLAQGILESRSGLSRLATEGNNHFGIKCHNDWDGGKIYEDDETNKECFRKYKNAKESFEDHSVFLMKKRYEPLFKLKTDDYKGWAKGLRECGYATNSKYANLLIKIIEESNLEQYDKLGMEYIKKGTIPGRSTPDSKENKKEEKSRDKKKDKAKDKNHDGEEGTDLPKEININNNYPVVLSSNGVKYTIARGDETQETIAEAFDMNAWQIRNYNDLEKGYVPQKGEIIYLQPKRNKGTAESHVVQAGENLRDISQLYAIKLSKLQKLNGIEEGLDVKEGMKVKLR